jgi:anti-anti-sigma regulatory factor
MDFEYQISTVGSQVIIRLAGWLPSGSSGNSCTSAVTDELRAVLDATSATEVVIDCRSLAYEFGDSLGAVWLVPMAKGLKCRIIATGETKEAIARLTRSSVAVLIEEP